MGRVDAMEEERSSGHPQNLCNRCLYFQADEYTGYCRLHHMYALKTFDCPKFVQRQVNAPEEGGVDGKEGEKEKR